jgi:hypothetical protein
LASLTVHWGIRRLSRFFGVSLFLFVALVFLFLLFSVVVIIVFILVAGGDIPIARSC